MELESFIRDIPDWPSEGIIFKDITPLLKDPGALREAVAQMAAPYRGQGVELVAGAESRGFIFASAIALELDAGFVPIRKPGKLPWESHRMEYELEYGTDALEIHSDAIARGQKVLMVDDLLATGGTMKACCDLVRLLGGEIAGLSFLVELTFLPGRAKLADFGKITSLIQV